jgi:hypothetical protein
LTQLAGDRLGYPAGESGFWATQVNAFGPATGRINQAGVSIRVRCWSRWCCLCRIGRSQFVEKVEVAAGAAPGKGGDMTEYLIAFNDEWVPDHTEEELGEKSKALKPLVAEMKAAGVLIFTGGLDDAAPVFSVDASSGTPLFTDGPFVESKEHLGGFALVDVADEEAARLWAGKIAVACGWPQEVRRFRIRRQLSEMS